MKNANKVLALVASDNSLFLDPQLLAAHEIKLSINRALDGVVPQSASEIVDRITPAILADRAKIDTAFALLRPVTKRNVKTPEEKAAAKAAKEAAAAPQPAKKK